jgi:hypothetical protein
MSDELDDWEISWDFGQHNGSIEDEFSRRQTLVLSVKPNDSVHPEDDELVLWGAWSSSEEEERFARRQTLPLSQRKLQNTQSYPTDTDADLLHRHGLQDLELKFSVANLSDSNIGSNQNQFHILPPSHITPPTSESESTMVAIDDEDLQNASKTFDTSLTLENPAVRQMKRHNAAIIIGHAWMTFKLRKAYLHQRMAAITIQSWWRSRLSRMIFLRFHSSIVTIQKWYRKHRR